ncbi:transaldolase [Sulfuricaulis limicola]|uniref:Transaldolase n=1 Tax=Sulfuricaulis limicola TaxID=1620215 RepID=A0A1B4XFY9_9GAMM|nr:transaldolase [Sulfuricaulis limicola]BAV33695.1 transaldolase [Sulfuricaulis limicola]
MTAPNPLLVLKSLGQSVWLDYIERGMLVSGKLTHMIERDGLAGITSNPSIFEKAITGHEDYEADIARLARHARSAMEIYEPIVLADIGHAADLFLPVYEQTRGRDGFVSIEVSPHLASDTDKTVKEAVRLWEKLHRPNIMIKVPGTAQGLPAVRRLIAQGINVNVTLLFGLSRYREVLQAWLSGLEDRAQAGLSLDSVDSVASFFLSRIDVLVDQRLDALAESGDKPAASLRGTAAIACARLAYRIYGEMHSSERWQRLAARGAHTQRLLWASTSAKDPAYSPVKYVEPLIGPETVNTLPPETLDAYRRQGDPAARLEQDLPQADVTVARLAQLGIDLEAVARQLEEEGVKKFVAPFDKLLASLEQRRQQLAPA